jgi:hypothetical protein
MKVRNKKMDQQEVLTSPTNIKRRFLELPALWLRLGQMNESFFSSELPRTSIANTAYSVLLVTICTAILTVMGSFLGFLTGYAKAPAGTNPLSAVRAAGIVAIMFTCFGLVITPLSFYLNNGIAFVSALIFGGKGKYSSQTYLDSFYYVPLGLLGGLISLLSAIPKAGVWIVSVITLGVAIYSIVLRIRVFKVVHGFGTAKAVVAVLAPVILILIPLCIIMVLMIMGPAIGNVFSTINSQLGTPVP